MKIVIAGLIGLMLSVGARAESEVSGQVRFAGGEPVGGADVMLFDVSDEQRGVVAKATTDEAGQFVLALTAAGSAQPMRFSLGQSYPNPFNPSTIIPYELTEAARVRLDVFNLLGQRVTTLVDDEQVAGSYTARWDARDASGQGVASGVYLYRLTAASTSSADKVMATRRMVLVDGSAGAVGAGGSVAETVDMVETVEVPVYGLAVEVEGLKTYVDSAFVVVAGPVEVVLDEGRGKAVVQEVDEGEVAVRWHFGDLDFSLLDGDNQGVESTVDDDIIDDINDQIKDVCPQYKKEIKFAYQDGFLVSEMDVELYKCITGLDKDQSFSAKEGVKTLRNDAIFFAASTAVKLVAVIAASIGAALAAKLIAIAAAVGYVFTAISGIGDVQYITNASGNIVEEHVSSTRVGFLGNFTTDNKKIIPGTEYIPFLMVKNEKKEAKVIPLKLVSSFEFHRGITTVRLRPTARVLGTIMGSIRIQPQKGYVIIPPNTVSLEFNPNEQTFPDHEWDRRVRFWFDTDSWFFSRKLTLDVARGHSYIPEFTAIRGSGLSGNTLFLDASPSVLPNDADAEYRWLYNNHTAFVSMDLGSGPQLSVPLSVFEDELVNGLGSMDIQLAVTVGEVRVVKRKLVEIIGNVVSEEPVDDPPDMVVDTLTLLPAVVDTLTSLPAVIETHTPVTVQVRVANEGNGRARQVLVVLRVNGRVVDSIALDFDAGHQTGVEFDPQVLGVGSHSIEVEVDPDGNLTSETVRGNNLVSQTLTLTPQLAAARSVVFILDLSGSMDNAAGDGGTRLEAAKAALAQVLAQAPRDGSQEYALTTFSGCGGVEVPIGFTGDAQTVVSYSSGLVANGGTPLAAALRRAQHLALDEASSDDVLLVLLSDGEETCDGDPVGVARLIGQGVRAKVVASLGTQAKAIKVNAIGFGVEPGSAADQQIQAIAKEAGGNYFRASEAADLAVALGQALVQTGGPTLSGRVTDEDGNPIQGALVQLRNMQENTDANGRYLFPARVQGVDSLIVTAEGYARFEAEVYLFDVDKEFDVRLTRGGGGRVGEERVFSLPGGGEMAFVWIGPGVFQMGSPESEEGRDSNEGPLHEVEISRGFWLGKYEITQGEWEEVMGDNPSNYKGDARPVERVSWYDVHEFIGRLNDAAGDSLYRLPSEAEWEYACRAGTSTRWSFGNDESQLTGYAWYNGNTKPWSTRAVGQKLPNPWGLYDMYGNVWEWVQDWYDLDYYNSPPRVDPPGPNTGSDRVRRGGYFRNRARDLRSAERAYSSPGVSTGYIGVRLLRINTP